MPLYVHNNLPTYFCGGTQLWWGSIRSLKSFCPTSNEIFHWIPEEASGHFPTLCILSCATLVLNEIPPILINKGMGKHYNVGARLLQYCNSCNALLKTMIETFVSHDATTSRFLKSCAHGHVAINKYWLLTSCSGLYNVCTVLVPRRS